MSAPGDKLEQSIAAELARINGGNPPAEDEPPTDEEPPTPDGEEEPVEEEAAGPDDTEEGEEEGEDEGGERAVEGEPAIKPGKKPGRANVRIQALSKRAQEAEARLAQVEAQRIADEQRRAAEARAAEDRRLEAEIAALPPEEQPAKRQEVFNRRVAQTVNGLQSQLADTQDQAAFQAAASADPILKAISPRVEAIAAQYRANGNVVNRETIANYVLGQLARSPEGRRLLMQKTPTKKVKRTPTSRGDAGRGGGGTHKNTSGEPTRAQLMERLKGKSI